jgi:hypothetical protein
MGTVSAAYDVSGNDDFETIGVPGIIAAIWDDIGSGFSASGTQWAIGGQMTPMAGDFLSKDGTFGGANFRHPVTKAGSSTCFVESEPSSGTLTVCNAIILQDVGQFCQGGDSGGPIFQRQSTAGVVLAAGILQSGSYDSSTGVDTCAGQEISHVESTAHINLLQTGG